MSQYCNMQSYEIEVSLNMAQDVRLARLLHVLIHMHLRGGSTSSETISQMLHTNPVVVRRTMAALRDAGYVASAGGRSGGWTLACGLDALTVGDIHTAIASASPFAFGPAQDNPQCPVEAVVNHFVSEAQRAAENELLRCFQGKRLSVLAKECISFASEP